MSEQITSFRELNLPAPILKSLEEIGYEKPSPIQAAAIVPLLRGDDIIGQAQTGTGKTAAFALPLLSKLSLKKSKPQILVLTPTRELAIQVAEAFQTYARNLPGFHVLPIYGGQGIDKQLKALKRNPHVIVGTPGRVMDHMRRKSLDISSLTSFVLDEADEMLQMGFIEDVEWILEHAPEERQIALFSATMPPAIRKVASKYLQDPVEVVIKAKTTTVASIQQFYWRVDGLHKLDALTRILESEEYDAAIIFVRTRVSTNDLAERMEARGFACAALNGDISQAQREKTVDQLKRGTIDIVIATDVAARGLDVKRITHVINYDIPQDTESYVHRIGRTGRAGLSGKAILFVSSREMRMLRTIENATRQKIENMNLPTLEAIADIRVERLTRRILETLENEDLSFYDEIAEKIRAKHEVSPERLLGALTYLAQLEKPILPDLPEIRSRETDKTGKKTEHSKQKDKKRKSDKKKSDLPYVRYRIEVGKEHGATPGEILAAIANETGISGEYIGSIQIGPKHSVVELPDGMPKVMLQQLKKTRVCQRPLKMARLDSGSKKTEKKSTAKSALKPDKKGKKLSRKKPV